MPAKRQRLHIDPYYCPPRFDGGDPNSPLSSPSPSFSFSPPTDISSTTSRTPMSAGPEWRICYVLCFYDFTSSDADHLSFRKNEILEIVKKEQSGWWAALRDDRIGWVPSAFVIELTDEDAENLRNVREELRVYEFEAERLYSAGPISSVSRISDATFTPVSAHGHGRGCLEDENWVPIVEPGGKMPFTQAIASGFIVTDFPDDIVPLSGVSASPLSHPHTDSLDTYSTDSEPVPPPDKGSLAQAIAYPPSPVTPMPHPFRPDIAPLLMNKPTPPTPLPPILSSPSCVSPHSPLARNRSDSAPSSNKNMRRRPIMMNSSLSRLSVLLDSPHVEADNRGDEALHGVESGMHNTPTGRRTDKVRQLTGDDDAQAFHNAKIALANLPWYLQPSYSPDLDIKLEYDGNVRAGTLPALVERLTVDPLKLAQEKLYRDAFLTTFCTFTTANEFFNLLIERYEMDHPSSLTHEEFIEWRDKKLRPVQKRVLAVLSMWLEDYGLLEDDPDIAPQLKDFLDLVISPPSLAFSAKLILQSLNKLTGTALLSPPLPPFPSTPTKRSRPSRVRKNTKELLCLDPADLAAQLMLFEHRLYIKVRPRECLRWAKSQSGDTNGVANLSAFCATHDKVAAWVKGSVLANDGLGKRADTVDFWIKVAEKCRALNNFSSTSAIVAALSSAVLARLHLTWAHVERTSHLEVLVRLNEPAGNFSAYRQALQAVNGPCIPFIGIFLTDIVHIQDQLNDKVSFPIYPQNMSPDSRTCCTESVPDSTCPSASVSSSSTSSLAPTTTTLVPVSHMSPPLINFVKRQKLCDAVRAIMRFQGKAPAISENAPLLTIVTEQLARAGVTPEDQQALWTRSQELQQSETGHADIRKGLEAAGF